MYGLLCEHVSIYLGQMPKSVPLSLNKAGADQPGRSFRRLAVPIPEGRGLVGHLCFVPHLVCLISHLNTVAGLQALRAGDMEHAMECIRSYWPLVQRYRDLSLCVATKKWQEAQ